MWIQHSRIDLLSIVPLALLVLAALAAALPLERVPRAGQAVGAWAAIVLVLGLQVVFRIRAVDVAALLSLPLAWLAIRHEGRSLAIGIGLALAVCAVSLVVVRDPYTAVATLAAIVVPVAIKALTGRGADRARFASVAYTDFLTTCPNRRALVAELPRRLETARRREIPLAIAIFDLDRFGAFNEDWGHAAGDRLLTDVADRAPLHPAQRPGGPGPLLPRPGRQRRVRGRPRGPDHGGRRRAGPRRGDRPPRRLHGQRRDRLLGPPRGRRRPAQPRPARALRRRHGPWAGAGWSSTTGPARGPGAGSNPCPPSSPAARSNRSTNRSGTSPPAA